MRIIEYEAFSPIDGHPSAYQAELLDFLAVLSPLSIMIRSMRQLPPIDDINRITRSGQGDDGLVLLRWKPFEVQCQECSALEAELISRAHDHWKWSKNSRLHGG